MREKLKQQEGKIMELETENIRLRSAKDSITDIVNVIRSEQQVRKEAIFGGIFYITHEISV